VAADKPGGSRHECFHGNLWGLWGRGNCIDFLSRFNYIKLSSEKQSCTSRCNSRHGNAFSPQACHISDTQPKEHPLVSQETRTPVDLFQKCRSFTRADEIKAAGYYPYFRPIEENEGPVVMIEGRKIIMAGSNNYHGLTADPRVKQAAIEAIKKYGTGCSGSRYLTGTLDLHIKLEERIAAFMGKESCLLFSTGYQTAQGIIPTLVQKGDYVVSDRDNHACIVAGNLMAKGAFAEFVRYKHNDMDDLERVLSKLPRRRRSWSFPMACSAHPASSSISPARQMCPCP